MSIPAWRCLNHMEESKWGNWNPIPLSLLKGFFSQRALGAGLLASLILEGHHPSIGGTSTLWALSVEMSRRLSCLTCRSRKVSLFSVLLCLKIKLWTEWYGRPSAIAFFLGVLHVSSSIDRVWLLNGSLSLFGYIQEPVSSWAMASTLKMGSKIAGSNSAPEGTLYYLVSGLLQEIDHSSHIQ